MTGRLIPDVSPDVVRWPMSLVVLPPVGTAAGTGVHDVLVVLCSRIQRGGAGGGALDFVYLGTSAAVFTVGADGVPNLQQVVEITPDDPSTTQVDWGAAATVHGPWLFVYGTRWTGAAGTFGRELYVARAPADDPGNRDLWRFWDGSAWQPELPAATPVLPAVGGVSQTLSVHFVDGVFVAVSKRDGDLGDFVYTWTSKSPVGPWQPRQGASAPARLRHRRAGVRTAGPSRDPAQRRQAAGLDLPQHHGLPAADGRPGGRPTLVRGGRSALTATFRVIRG